MKKCVRNECNYFFFCFLPGTFLAGGAENGFLWMVEPNLMILAGSSPLQFTSEKIRLVLFSLDSKHLVCVVRVSHMHRNV